MFGFLMVLLIVSIGHVIPCLVQVLVSHHLEHGTLTPRSQIPDGMHVKSTSDIPYQVYTQMRLLISIHPHHSTLSTVQYSSKRCNSSPVQHSDTKEDLHIFSADYINGLPPPGVAVSVIREVLASVWQQYISQHFKSTA
jgi:hypothetical protein